jgi:hypothetical protein
VKGAPLQDLPAPGDVLVSRPTARSDAFAISLFPTQACVVVRRYQDALEKAREVAGRLAVDGWYTCDHTHFARIALHRHSRE